MLKHPFDVDLPLSPIFIDFLARSIDKTPLADDRWFDQRSEELVNPGPAIRRAAQARLERLILDQDAQDSITAVYRWFQDLLVGRSEALIEFQKNYHFLCIVGLGRSGGSYLTAELFSALGFNPAEVPTAIAHDGFPTAHPFSLRPEGNAWIACIHSMSEFLAMVEIFYRRAPCRPIVIPKKLLKGVYAGGLFNTVLGPATEYVITIRHPLASCISTYEKSGGLPQDGKYRQRSNIETWIRRDLVASGMQTSEVEAMDYFDAFVHYWEQFYINLALGGLIAHQPRVIVPFGKAPMENLARSWQQRFGSEHTVSEFVIDVDLKRRHPEWLARSEQAMDRVKSVWQLVGLEFPTMELGFCL